MNPWKTIPNFDKQYQINPNGEVRIHPSFIGDNRINALKASSLVSVHTASDGYRRVNLRRNGKQGSYHIHRLLLLTFRPTKITNLQVNHIDGDKLNNNFDNLEWCSQVDNLRHAWETGLRSQPCHVKLTEDQVREIRATYSKNGPLTQKDLGKRFGVTSYAIHKIVTRKNWKHI